MFNDDEVKKSGVLAALYVFCFLCIIGALVSGILFAIGDLGGAEPKMVQPEIAPTVKYEKEEEPTTLLTTETETEALCQHNWIISDKYLTLIRNVKLECIASEGIDVVYLTRYRGSFENSYDDIYIAYDEHLKDITLQYFDGVFEIEYFPAGVGMGTPRLEEYKFTLYACENEDCNSLQHVADENLTLYRFYIPEGTYLISH